MKIEKWVQDSAGRLDAVVLLDAGEKPSTVQVLEFVDRQAGAEKIWLLGRATLQRKDNRVLVLTCVRAAAAGRSHSRVPSETANRCASRTTTTSLGPDEDGDIGG